MAERGFGRAHRALAGLTAAVLLAGCSTRPREFEPQLALAGAPTAGVPADLALAETAVDSCTAQVAAGKRSHFGGAAAAAGGGVAAAYGAGLLAAGGGGSATMVGGMAAAAAGAATMVLIAPVAMVGISRMVRASKEREIKAAMSTCLAEHGYEVGAWEPVKKRPRREDRP